MIPLHLMTSTPKSNPNEAFGYIQVREGYAIAIKDAVALVKIPINLVFGDIELPDECYIKGTDWKAAKMNKAVYMALTDKRLTAYNKLRQPIGSLDIKTSVPFKFPDYKAVIREEHTGKEVNRIGFLADYYKTVSDCISFDEPSKLRLNFDDNNKAIHVTHSEISEVLGLVMPLYID